MAKVIAVSGPQGGGKTTLLNGLKNDSIFVDDFKVSREVQKIMGADKLVNLTEEPELMKEFQDLIITLKMDRDLENTARDVEYVLTERSFADIFVYAKLWSSKLVEKDRWTAEEMEQFLQPYLEDCAAGQEIYSSVIYVPATDIPWEDDPRRASKDDVFKVAEALEMFFMQDQPKDTPVYRMMEKSVEGRIVEAQRWIKYLS